MLAYQTNRTRTAECQFLDLVGRQGDIAQMVERSLSMREVSGSIPDISIFAIVQ